MKVTRISKYSGIERTIDLDITEEQLKRYEEGEYIQKAFPHLTPSQREFILTGCTDEEWLEMFPLEDEEDELQGNDLII